MLLDLNFMYDVLNYTIVYQQNLYGNEVYHLNNYTDLAMQYKNVSIPTVESNLVWEKILYSLKMLLDAGYIDGIVDLEKIKNKYEIDSEDDLIVSVYGVTYQGYVAANKHDQELKKH